MPTAWVQRYRGDADLFEVIGADGDTGLLIVGAVVGRETLESFRDEGITIKVRKPEEASDEQAPNEAPPA